MSRKHKAKWRSSPKDPPLSLPPSSTPTSSPTGKGHCIKSVEPKRAVALRFLPSAWAKLLYFRGHGTTEVGGFGVASPEDPLLVREFVTVKQVASAATVTFDDGAVADFFDAQVDAGNKPEGFARIWLHTHPGMSPTPSTVDEETFKRVFGRCEWSVMFVLGQGNKAYARLRFNVGPGGEIDIPVEVDFSGEFPGSGHAAWEEEFKANVEEETWASAPVATYGGRTPVRHWKEGSGYGSSGGLGTDDAWGAEDVVEGFQELGVEQRREVLEELANRPDLWDD